jgi:hypothetical protein
VAEENTALVADEGAQLAPEDQQQPPADETPEPIANLARDMGWTPKDDWHGDPEKWKPAEQFIRDGRDIQQSTSRELKTVREQLERIGGVTETIIRDKVAERDAYWKTQFNQAVEDGDTEKANQLLDQRPTAQPAQQGPAPEVTAWVAKNPWFNTDPLAASVAREVSARNQALPVAEQLAAAEKEVKRRFPEHFAPAAKAPPATQTGAARNANPSNRQKGFADMPGESQAVARDMVKRNPSLTLEAFAKSYWEQEGVKR